ncbi:MAG: hydroxyacylglutathione hydrolase [Oxalobacter sp.]|nr:MAG: hydroxyacylglutathione hydrolase [Oxalobacter sp.]
MPSQSAKSLAVLTVPAFRDNYIWVIHNGHHAVVVDPGEAAPVQAALDKHELTLAAIVLTHHHNDHMGGVESLLQKTSVPVFGPRHEKTPIQGVSHPVSEGDNVTIPSLPLRLKVLDTPGHTLGHISYHAETQRWLFCGDTLFTGGCGRLLEGSPQQMTASLAKLAALPDNTLVYCAHEYTLSNLQFALAVEPANHALQTRMAEAQAQRAQGQPTVPSTIALEKATNPFLRYTEPAIMENLFAKGLLKEREAVLSFAAIREWKNSF